MQMHNMNIGIIKDFIETFEQGRAALIAAAPRGEDVILAWPHHLAVHVTVKDGYSVGGIASATAFKRDDKNETFGYPVIMNGAGQMAMPTLRKDALKAALAETEDMLDKMRKALVEATEAHALDLRKAQQRARDEQEAADRASKVRGDEPQPMKHPGTLADD